MAALLWLLGACVTADSDFLPSSFGGFFAVSGGGVGSRKAHPCVRVRDGCSQHSCISSDWKMVVLSP